MPLLKPWSLEEEEAWRRRFSQDQKKDLIREYVELRLLLEDPMAAMEVKVLQPMCQSCLRPWPEPDDPPISYGVKIHAYRDTAYLYPGSVKPRRTYLAEYGLMMFDQSRHEVQCHFCKQEVEDSGMFHVMEESFQQYFCLEDKAKGLPLWLRKHILDCYGSRCLLCNDALSIKTLSIDHIVPKSKGGDSRPTNLQPLCAACNNSVKKDSGPRTSYIFLDFLTREPPSDSYCDLIW